MRLLETEGLLRRIPGLGYYVNGREHRTTFSREPGGVAGTQAADVNGPDHPRPRGLAHPWRQRRLTATGALNERYRGPDRPACCCRAVPGPGSPAGTRSGWPSVSGLERGHPGSAHSAAPAECSGWVERSAFRPLRCGARLPGYRGRRNRRRRKCGTDPDSGPVFRVLRRFRPVLKAPRRARARTDTVRGGQPRAPRSG